MIVKRIPAMPSARNAGGVRARHAQQLVDYLRLPEKADPYREYLIAYMASRKLPDMATERLLHIGARNFVAKTLDGQRLEMMATAQAAVRSANPIDHWLLSWRSGEFPSSAEVDETVAMFLADLGLAGAQAVYALHGDTHNRHVHIAVNRYDARSGRVIEINKGFNREAAHRAVARIVERFGWQAEREARYVMKDGTPALSASAVRRKAAGEVGLEPTARACEIRTGYASAQRVAQDIALPLIDRADSWAELHQALAEAGFAFDRKKRGAVLILDGEAVKASSLSRRSSLIQLEKRLGSFIPRPDDLVIDMRSSQLDVMPAAHRAEEYRLLRNTHTRAIITAKLGGNRRHGIKPPPKDIESFLLETGDRYFADVWAGRQREPIGAIVGGPQLDWVQPEAIDGYQAHRMADGVRYALPDGPTAFVDRGRKVEVVPGGDDAALVAALRLSATKFGQFKIEGSAAFRERATRLAIAHGLADHVVGLDKPALPRPSRLLDQALRAREVAPAGDHGQRRPRSKGGPAAGSIQPPPPTTGIRAQAAAVARLAARNGNSAVGSRKPPSSDVGTVPAWQVPDHRADPGRIALIDDVVERLGRVGYLPLILKSCIDGDGRPAQQFAIDRDLGDPLDRRHALFETAERLEEDSAIQRVYAENHRHAMDVAEAALREQPFDVRTRVRRRDFDHLERFGDGLARALHVLRDTRSVSAMIERLDRHWAEADRVERARVVARDAVKSRARSGERSGMEQSGRDEPNEPWGGYPGLGTGRGSGR